MAKKTEITCDCCERVIKKTESIFTLSVKEYEYDFFPGFEHAIPCRKVEKTLHYCSRECLAKWVDSIEPVEVAEG